MEQCCSLDARVRTLDTGQCCYLDAHVRTLDTGQCCSLDARVRTLDTGQCCSLDAPSTDTLSFSGWFSLICSLYYLLYFLCNGCKASLLLIVLLYRIYAHAIRANERRSNTQIAIAFARRNRPRVHRNDEFACVYLHLRAFVFVFVCEYCLRSTACAYVRACVRTRRELRLKSMSGEPNEPSRPASIGKVYRL